MTTFFTLIARGVSTTVPVAGGRVTPAGGVAPATAMVTAPVAEADGSVPTTATVTTPVAEADRFVPTSWHSGLGGEAGGLQKDNVSMQQYRYMTTMQEIHTWRTPLLVLSVCAQPDDPAGPKAEFQSTPRRVRGSCPFLPPPRLPFPPGGSRLQWTRCRAESRPLENSSLRLWRWGEGGPVEGCRVVEGSSGTILCVPAEGFQLAVAEQQNLFSTKSSRILTGFGGFCAEHSCRT
jgi:hypothetical protein